VRLKLNPKQEIIKQIIIGNNNAAMNSKFNIGNVRLIFFTNNGV